MDLKDARHFKQDVHGLMEFTSTFSTTEHDRTLFIMYDLGFHADAIEIVTNLHQYTATQVCLPQGGLKLKNPVKRGTIIGDTLSPFLFLLYMCHC